MIFHTGYLIFLGPTKGPETPAQWERVSRLSEAPSKCLLIMVYFYYCSETLHPKNTCINEKQRNYSIFIE